MKTKIIGKRYEFIVELEQDDKLISFEILSKHKVTDQKSTITNVNFIISELVFPIFETTEIDSTIFLNKQKGTKLFKEAMSSFKDTNWIELLEEKLDEDRCYGGWNSNFEI